MPKGRACSGYARRVPAAIASGCAAASIGTALDFRLFPIDDDRRLFISPAIREWGHLEPEGVRVVIDAGQCGTAMTTVINLTGAQPELVRAGQGSLAPFGLE